MAPSASTDHAHDDEEQRYERDRRELVAQIEAEYRETIGWTGRDELNPRVKNAMANVPRHEFVPKAERWFAYINNALPIGWRQTISQPYIVALMTDLLDLEPGDVVLEIGTGSGYQAAILSLLVNKVYSIEVVPELAEGAAEVLARLGYDNVEVRAGDGTHGWPEHAPFDKIIVTAEAAEIPGDLIEQLKAGGKLIMPVGDWSGQLLTLVEKRADGTIDKRVNLPVTFVPLISKD